MQLKSYQFYQTVEIRENESSNITELRNELLQLDAKINKLSIFSKSKDAKVSMAEARLLHNKLECMTKYFYAIIDMAIYYNIIEHILPLSGGFEQDSNPTCKSDS